MIDLKQAVVEINEILEAKRKELKLTFEEESHTYTMLDKNGILHNNWVSVSGVVDEFYENFNAFEKATQMSRGDDNIRDNLLCEWSLKGSYATNKGSRVHYELEKYLVELLGNYKDVRQPLYECDEQQMFDSDKMIIAGKKFIKLMMNRGAVSLNSEIIMGSPLDNYVGQCDNGWLMLNKTKDNIVLILTDWKTNQKKNFEIQHYTNNLYPPFDNYPSTALQHYYIQVSLYGRLFLYMLKGSKWENLKFAGGVIVLLKDDGEFEEYKIPKLFVDTIMTMDLSPYIKNKKKEEKYYD
jgi:hypothetical protein